MSCPTLFGVYREHVFSPGKVIEDAAILDATLLELSRKGHKTHALRPESLDFHSSSPALVLSMAQSEVALNFLEGLRRHGAVIINSVQSVRNCYRKALICLLKETHLPIPESRIVSLDELENEKMVPGSSPRYWLKRGDVHAMQSDDVVMVASGEEFVRALKHFRNRKVEDILVQEHVDGSVIKFYGVGPGDYFVAFLESTGEEIISTDTGDFSVPMEQLSKIAYASAEAVGLEIFGGDAILTPQDKIVLIDIND